MSDMRPKLSRRLAVERFRDRCDVLGSISTAATRDVDQASACKLGKITSHILRTEIKPSF